MSFTSVEYCRGNASSFLHRCPSEVMDLRVMTISAIVDFDGCPECGEKPRSKLRPVPDFAK